jgi:hypothetical protein
LGQAFVRGLWFVKVQKKKFETHPNFAVTPGD